MTNLYSNNTLTRKTGIYTKVDIVMPDLPWYLDTKLVGRLRARKDIGKIPEFMIRDVFKLYYNRNMNYQMVPSMYWWHKILQKVNNYMLKMITQDRIGYSYLVTLHILRNIRKTLQDNPGWKTMNNKRNNEIKKLLKWMERMKKAQAKDKKREQKGQPPLHVPRMCPKPDQPIENSTEYLKFLKDLKAQIKVGLKEATGSIRQLISLEGDGDGAGSVSCDQVDDYIKTGKLEDGFPAKALQDFVRNTLMKFKDSQVGKKFFIEESLFEAEEIDEICSYEDFAHIALLADATVKSEMRHLFFDVYVDVSGSMCSTRALTKKGQTMEKLGLARAIAYKLKNLGMIDKLYCFDTKIWEVQWNEFDKMNTRGGTHIDSVLEHAKAQNRPCMIITDCEDTINLFYDNAFILSVEPYIRATEGFKEMIKSKNAMIFYKGDLSKPVAYEREHLYAHPTYIQEQLENN